MKEYTVADLFHTDWLGLSPEKILRIVDLCNQLDSAAPGSKSYGLLLISLLRLLRRNKRLVSKLSVEQAVDCFNDLAFIKRKSGRFVSPWYHFPVRSFSKRGFDFTCPDRSELPLVQMSFVQLCYADAAFSAYCVIIDDHIQETENVKKQELLKDADRCLCSLMAILYSPAVGFDIAEMDKKAAALSKIYQVEKLAVLHTYANIRRFFTERCPNLFPTTESAAAPDPAGRRPEFTGPMWQDLRYSLAESPVFQGLKTASDARLYDALDYLEKKQTEAIEQKKQGNSQV